MRVTLVIHAIVAGGAERVATAMANFWAKKGWQVTLLTFDDGSVQPFFDLDSRINHTPLNLAKDSRHLLAAGVNNLRRVLRLRGAIRKSRPRCVISFLDQANVVTLLATRGSRFPVIVSEQIYPASHSIGRTWESLRRWSYTKADCVVAVTARALSCFSLQIQNRGRVIPNPVSPTDSYKDETTGKLLDRPALLAVGRLVPQKGFDLLLKAFAQLKDRHAGWTLNILGEGPLRPELDALRHQLGIADRVNLFGNVSDPGSFMRQADLFVMSSRFEGFPVALGEAMAYALPVISTDCPSGPAEIIRDGVDGILVPNEDNEALVEAMDRLMSDEALRLSLSSRAPEVAERFSLEKIMSLWEELLDEVIQQ